MVNMPASSTQVNNPTLPFQIRNTDPLLTDGRGYPDIAAQGLYFEYVWNNSNGVISGTSAATPLMSSVLALVNDALISSGLKPLGFLNPWLYSKGYKGFTDILSGGNGGCNTTGFPVTKGWDAVTGFGDFFLMLVKNVDVLTRG